MNRHEYLKELDEHLISLSDEERELAVNFYTEYFDEAGEENEQSVMDELGKPFQLAKSIISEQSAYSKSEVYIKFRESNPLNKETGVYASIKKESVPYPPPSYSENIQGDSAPDIIPGQADNPEDENGSSQYQPRNEAYSSAGTPSGNNYDFGYTDSASSGSFSGETYNYQKKGVKNNTNLVLWIIFIVFIGIPVILPVISGLFAALIGLVAAVAAFFAAGIILIIAGIISVILSIVRFITLGPADGLVLLGSGFVCAGLGILILIPSFLFCSKTVPWCFKGLAKLLKKCFRRGDYA